MPRAKNHYRIELLLCHTEMSAAAILKSLPLVPRIKESIGEDHAKMTFISAPLQEGYSNGECQDALKKVAAFIATHKQFLKNFSRDQGALEIVVHHAIDLKQNAGEECLNLALSSAFLQELASSSIRFRIIGWEREF